MARGRVLSNPSREVATSSASLSILARGRSCEQYPPIIPIQYVAGISFAVVSLLLPTFSRVVATDWPEGYVVHENSESPDGQYRMIVPGQESEEGDNYLANPKTHQVLGKINGVDYVEG